MEKHSETVTNTRIVVDDVTFKPFEMLKNSCIAIRDFDGWVQLSGIVKTLMQMGVINLDVVKDKILLNYIFLNLPLEQINSYVDEFSIKDKK